jgi:hypothetical protein
MNVEPCERCGGRSLLLVPWMVEHAYSGWVGLGFVDGLEPMQTLICRDCGHVAWYCPPTADHPERPGQSRRIIDERLRCQGCDRHAHLLIARFQELVSKFPPPDAVPLMLLRREMGGTDEHFAVLTCDGCGRVSWFACNVSSFAGEACDGACARCSVGTLRRIRPFVEEDGRRLPVALRKDEPVGKLELRWCESCGACDWRALGKDWHNGDGVEPVTAGEVRHRDPLSGGPYR